MFDKEPVSGQRRFYRIRRKITFLMRRGSLFRIRPSTAPGYKPETIARGTFPIIFFNSTVIFLLAFFLLDTITKMATAISAKAFDFNTVVLYYAVEYLVLARDWSTDSVQVVFSTGPVFAFILGIHVKVMEETGILRLLLLWLFAHCLVFLFGDILAGALLSKGFGYVIMYLFFMDTGKMIITVFAIVALITIGLFMSRLFLYTGNIYFNSLTQFNRGRFVRHQFLYPWIAGDIIIILLKLPDVRIYEIALNFTMIFLLLPAILRSRSIQDLWFDEEPRTIRFSLVLTGITILFMIAYRIVLGYGIRL
jgi:hypothetical protein